MLILEQWKQDAFDGGVFPLFTKQDMAERWGVSLQTVNNWSRRHENFPVRLIGVMANDKEDTTRPGAGGGLYPFYELRRYEQNRGLKNE